MMDADDCGNLPLGSLPLLVYDHGLDPRHTFVTIGDGSIHTRVVPELANNYYHATPSGWILLVAPGSSPRTRLWDPRSRESVSLPSMEQKLPVTWKCYLADVPTAASCVVIVLDIHKPNFLYCRVGDSRWSTHEYDVGEVIVPLECTTTQKIVIQQGAAMGGKFYFQEKGKLGTIDFSSATPEFSYLDYQPVDYPEGSNCFREFLLESQGDIFNVDVFCKGFNPAEILTVEVYKMGLSSSTPALTKVDDLGDRVFLLSYPNRQGLCSASKYGFKGNRVYFNYNVQTREPDGGPICIYDLDDQSLENLRPCQGILKLFDNPFWMLPTDQECTGQ
ncbi:hypothetical protein QOZ80_1AG0042380 [Eleusine coracana subsp. coracana]|nr:hypothetical protein QOZ80_1AG0042380 [Eleusine coracana subsp. coracana]